mmetsp:Transcript_12862/g.31313  ORF Transcript_12862/g.31313 Transcript_12862/m.31313 type:complete len:254 (-) Transcript_12862:287-1048(-)
MCELAVIPTSTICVLEMDHTGILGLLEKILAAPLLSRPRLRSGREQRVQPRKQTGADPKQDPLRIRPHPIFRTRVGRFVDVNDEAVDVGKGHLQGTEQSIRTALRVTQQKRQTQRVRLVNMFPRSDQKTTTEVHKMHELPERVHVNLATLDRLERGTHLSAAHQSFRAETLLLLSGIQLRRFIGGLALFFCSLEKELHKTSSGRRIRRGTLNYSPFFTSHSVGGSAMMEKQVCVRKYLALEGEEEGSYYSTKN